MVYLVWEDEPVDEVREAEVMMLIRCHVLEGIAPVTRTHVARFVRYESLRAADVIAYGTTGSMWDADGDEVWPCGCYRTPGGTAMLWFGCAAHGGSCGFEP